MPENEIRHENEEAQTSDDAPEVHRPNHSAPDSSRGRDDAPAAAALSIAVSENLQTSDSASAIVRTLLEQYRDVESDYTLLVLLVKGLLQDALKRQGVDFLLVEGRAKDADRVVDKASRPHKQYKDPLQDITDLAGVRVVVRRQADLSAVVESLKGDFHVDPNRSIDKRAELDEDRFGYRAGHYIVRLKRPPSDRPRLSELCAEIQVRTVLEDAWARASRGSLYESAASLPRALRRRFYSLAALLELADRELDDILTESARLIAEAKADLDAQDLELPLNVPNLVAYLESSSMVQRWVETIEGLGVAVGPIGAVDRDVMMAREAGLGTVAEVDAVLRAAGGWGDDFLAKFFENDRRNLVQVMGSVPDRMTDRNGTVTLFLIATFPDLFTKAELEGRWGWGAAWRAIEARPSR